MMKRSDSLQKTSWHIAMPLISGPNYLAWSPCQPTNIQYLCSGMTHWFLEGTSYNHVLIRSLGWSFSDPFFERSPSTWSSISFRVCKRLVKFIPRTEIIGRTNLEYLAIGLRLSAFFWSKARNPPFLIEHVLATGLIGNLLVGVVYNLSSSSDINGPQKELLTLKRTSKRTTLIEDSKKCLSVPSVPGQLR